jgi:hypothetical protein
MRITEIICEDLDPVATPGMDPLDAPRNQDLGQQPNHNDKAEAHGYNDIMNALVTTQSQLAFTHAIPREETSKIVAMVNAERGDNSFRWTDLNDAIKSGQFKDVVEKIEPDEKTGVNYVYFVTPETQVQSTIDGGGTGGNGGSPKDSGKVVSQMAKRAAGT